jgi:MarR-like DNA-binding transcriptional regulator SgrR of sgrS sRNA
VGDLPRHLDAPLVFARNLALDQEGQRDGLMFHDGTKVLARDCVASIKRWGVSDVLGQALMQRNDELSAPDDRTIVFRLKKPFVLLPDPLGKVAGSLMRDHTGAPCQHRSLRASNRDGR